MGIKKDNIKTLSVEAVAERRGVSTSYIYKVLNTERNNDQLVEDVITVQEELKNALLTAVKQLVPFK